ncbi:MAG TPA: hypothetical protein PKW90_18025, partial [Myxococcota bacterium]|nr:hypothetical protein [Myxococcota bacterium]
EGAINPFAMAVTPIAWLPDRSAREWWRDPPNKEPAMATQTTALDTYLQRLPMILDKIEALRQLADDHFGHDPDAIHWGHVGDLGRVDQALDDLLAIFDGQAK